MNKTISPAYGNIRGKIERKECVVLDGAIATELQTRSVHDFRLSDAEHWGFEALQLAPDTVREVHGSYVNAGCDIITTNTYGILHATGGSGTTQSPGAPPIHWMDLARSAVLCAREAIDVERRSTECGVAFSIGGDIASRDDLRTMELLLRTFAENPPDLVLLETLLMMKNQYTREAIRLLIDHGLPVWVSFRRCRQGVCGIHGQLWGGPEGDFFGRLAGEMEDLGADAVLINCLPTQRVAGTIPWLRDFTDLPLGAYPNLGRYVDPEWKFDAQVTPQDYARLGLSWRAEGAQILGGCCGVRPEHIEALVEAVKGTRPGTISAEAAATRIAESAASTRIADPSPWQDASGRTLYPLPFPEIQCDPEVFLPTQGSHLVWKYLFNNRIGTGKRCLELGCGSGLLSVQLALNGAEHVMALDVQKEAVANTLTNAFRNGVNDRVAGEVADLFTFEPSGRYDLLVASLYQMPTDPMGELSGHRPVDYWGRNLLDHLIAIMPRLLEDDGIAYIMQISLLSQYQTQHLLEEAGFTAKVVDFNLNTFSSVFVENLEQIERVENASDAYHFTFQDEHVMVMYLLEVTRAPG